MGRIPILIPILISSRNTFIDIPWLVLDSLWQSVAEPNRLIKFPIVTSHRSQVLEEEVAIGPSAPQCGVLGGRSVL